MRGAGPVDRRVAAATIPGRELALTAEPNQPSLPPSLEARFEVVRLLGSGAFGSVLLAVDRALGRPVAVKLLYQMEHESETTDAARFEREARVTAQLQHPRIAAVYDAGRDGDQAYIVYQYVDGSNLVHHYLSRTEPFPPPEAAAILLQILEGLEVAHQAGVVHRDLKPANILVTAGGEIVITDFGLAAVQDHEALTRTGVMVGTPFFMPPDQMQGREPAPHWDLYAAALIFWEHVSGELPMMGRGLQELFVARLRGPEASLRELGVSLPASIEELLGRMLSGDPEQRPTSAAEVRRRFAEAFEFDVPEALPAALARGEPSAISSAPTLEASAVAPAGATPVAPRLHGRHLPAVAALLLGVFGGMLASGVIGTRSAMPPSGATPLSTAAVGVEAPDPVPPQVHDLSELVERLAARPEIAAGLAPSYHAKRSETERGWLAARRAFREEVNRYPSLREGPDPALFRPRPFSDLARVHLIETLLTRVAPRSGLPPTLPAETVSFTALTGTVVQVTAAPASEEGPRPFAAWLQGLGGTWALIRDVSPPGFAKRVHRQNLEGTPYLETQKDATTMAFYDLGRNVRGERESEVPAPEVEASLEPFDTGDLVLGMAVRYWDSTSVGLLEIGGVEETTRLCFDPPPPADASSEKPGERWQGTVLRVDRRVLPERPGRIRLRVLGVPVIGSDSVTVLVDQIHQLIAGPVPEALGGTRPPGGGRVPGAAGASH